MARAWQVYNVQTSVCSQGLQLISKQRLGGVTLQHDRLTGRVLQSFRKSPQWGNADSGTSQQHLSLGTRPATKASVRALEQRPCPRPQVRKSCAAVAQGFCGDPQHAAVGRDG